tara:strand:- start:274 stop:396 length:123 start_codon:yes stop_codon:yes gene_type:complete
MCSERREAFSILVIQVCGHLQMHSHVHMHAASTTLAMHAY